jgi:hypothetical protein
MAIEKNQSPFNSIAFHGDQCFWSPPKLIIHHGNQKIQLPFVPIVRNDYWNFLVTKWIILTCDILNYLGCQLFHFAWWWPNLSWSPFDNFIQPKYFGCWVAIKVVWSPFDLGQLFLVSNEIHPNPLLHKFLTLIWVSGLGISHPHWI